jgi:hypothetical protein
MWTMPPDPKRRKRPHGSLGALEDHQKRPAHTRNSPGAQAALVADPTFRRRVQRLYPLGDRVLALLLAHLAVEHDCRTEVERLLDRVIDNEAAIRAFGLVDRWPPLPTRGAP